MAKKKLLNEAQVRRFMGLAGIQPLKEMGYKMEEDEVEEVKYQEGLNEEEPMGDEPAPEAEMDAAGEEAEMDAEDTKEVSQELVDAIPDMIANLQELGDALGASGEAEAELEGEPMDELPPEEEGEVEEELPEPPEEEGGGEVLEALDGVNLELNEDELVQEVARRVAKRILKAKKAHKELNEALGKK